MSWGFGGDMCGEYIAHNLVGQFYFFCNFAQNDVEENRFLCEKGGASPTCKNMYLKKMKIEGYLHT